MPTIISVGGGNANVTVYGQGTILAGNGNDTLTIWGSGAVVAGNGDDNIAIHGDGTIDAGSGSDTLSLSGTGRILQSNASAHDTINLGSGSDTIYTRGEATVHGTFGGATFGNAIVSFVNIGSTHIEHAISGYVTLMGGAHSNEFLGGDGGHTVMIGGAGNDTFVGGAGHDTMTGGAGKNLFEFISAAAGGQHVITNFVSGQDQLYLEGYSLSYLQSHHDITVSGGNTYISLDGGKTTVELQGITSLKSTDVKH
jgi:Ca2+-binding RTX toxin-like protein